MTNHHHPVTAERMHVPELEQHAINQKPKDSGWTDLKLYRYNGSNLYQWWGRQRRPMYVSTTYSIFEAPCDEPFVILPVLKKATAFERVWAGTGYQYGRDALENVRLGWDLALLRYGISDDVPCFECGSTERIGTACAKCNPEITDPKFGMDGGEAALAIGEHAFRAGWSARSQWHRGLTPGAVDIAWGEYDPPEHIKALS